MPTVESKNKTTSESKTPSSNLKIFLIIFQIVFGYDFGFINYRSTRQKIIISIGFVTLPFVYGIAFILLILPDFNINIVIWYLVFVIECYSYIIILLLTSERNTFKKFLEHLQWIDSELKLENSSNYFDLKIILCCVIALAWKVWLRIYTSQPFSSIFAQIFYFFVFLPIRIPLVLLFFIFRATRVRLVALKALINEKPKQAQILYKNLVDSVESVRKPFNFIVSIYI